MQIQVIKQYLFSTVTKPTSKSFEAPPRPSHPAPSRSSVAPPKPAPPRPTPHAAAPQVDEEPEIELVSTNTEMPDIAKPEVDLLNMLPRSDNNAKIPPKEASFDLLGSFGSAEAQESTAMPDLLPQTKSQGLDDLFGTFGTTNTASNSNIPDLNSMGLNFNTANSSAPQANNINFDPFGNEAAFVSNADLLRPTSSESSPSQPPKQAHNSGQANKDPFADMANLASGLNLNWGAQGAPKPTAATSPQTTQFSSPTHQFGGFPPATSGAPGMARSPMDGSQKPDYSRSHFDTKAKQNGSTPAGAAPSFGTGDIFADILGQQGYNFATKAQAGPRSINEMRKEELVKDMDPDKLKIMEWVSELDFIVYDYFS